MDRQKLLDHVIKHFLIDGHPACLAANKRTCLYYKQDAVSGELNGCAIGPIDKILQCINASYYIPLHVALNLSITDKYYKDHLDFLSRLQKSHDQATACIYNSFHSELRYNLKSLALVFNLEYKEEILSPARDAI